MAGPKVKVRVETSAWRRVREAMLASPARVRVGILRATTHTTIEAGILMTKPISMLELAAIHEFGSPAANIPERSFIRSTVNTKRTELNEAIDNIVGRSIASVLRKTHIYRSDVVEATKKALGLVGQKAVALMRQTIRQRQTVGPDPQQLKPETIARKGSSLPLVDTGQLINAITYEVVEGVETEGTES